MDSTDMATKNSRSAAAWRSCAGASRRSATRSRCAWTPWISCRIHRRCGWKKPWKMVKNGEKSIDDPLVIWRNYGKIHHFEWGNPLFLWSFSIVTLNYQRVSIDYDHLFRFCCLFFWGYTPLTDPIDGDLSWRNLGIVWGWLGGWGRNVLGFWLSNLILFVSFC